MGRYYFQEIWTPLRLIGVRIFRDDEGGLWYKIGNHARKRIRK